MSMTKKEKENIIKLCMWKLDEQSKLARISINYSLTKDFEKEFKGKCTLVSGYFKKNKSNNNYTAYQRDYQFNVSDWKLFYDWYMKIIEENKQYKIETLDYIFKK